MKQEHSGAEALIASGNKLLAEAQASATGGARQLQGATGDLISAHPWKAAGIAAAAGLVVGLLISRR